MKRINPKTNLPFKRGDANENGLVFFQYKKNKIKKNKYFQENWVTPEQLKKYKDIKFSKTRSIYGTKQHQDIKENGRNYGRKEYLKPSGRAKVLIRSAKKRGNVLISLDWVIKKIEKGVCELTGLKFDLGQSNFYQNPYSPSLDRINPLIKEYSEKNTRIVLTAVNNSLNQYGEKVMLPILEAMIKSIKKNAKKNTITSIPT